MGSRQLGSTWLGGEGLARKEFRGLVVSIYVCGMWHGSVLECVGVWREAAGVLLPLPRMELMYLAVVCREGYRAEACCINTIQMVDRY
jgi:hypothetical protein